MATPHLLVVALVAISCFAHLGITAISVDSTLRIVHRKEPVDPHGKFLIEWEVDLTTNVITFSLNVETTGFVGFGFSRGGGKLFLLILGIQYGESYIIHVCAYICTVHILHSYITAVYLLIHLRHDGR
jgi:hypothetical protein